MQFSRCGEESLNSSRGFPFRFIPLSILQNDTDYANYTSDSGSAAISDLQNPRFSLNRLTSLRSLSHNRESSFLHSQLPRPWDTLSIFAYTPLHFAPFPSLPFRFVRSSSQAFLPRKEVIQPHLPIRLPCYDFTPVISLTFDGSSPASGAPNSHGVTGGVYKARERIHRGILIRDY